MHEEQIQLKHVINDFSSSTRPKNQVKKHGKNFFVFLNELFQGRRMVPNDFQSGIFPIRNEILMMMILNKRLC